MSSARREHVVLGLLVGLAAACRIGPPAIYLEVALEPSLGITQLSVTASAGGELSLGPVVRPAVEGEPLGAVESVRLSFPESLDGASIELAVLGLRGGAPVARAVGSARLSAGEERSLSLVLEGPPAPCGGSCGPGLECVEGECLCTPESCPDGCCRENACVRGDDASACGSAGRPCVACPPGEGCQAGQCSGCARTCASGCCSGATCHEPGLATCGRAGESCIACSPTKADGCVDGACVCGTGKACEPGQRCVSGRCICDARSCPSGCCEGDTCELRTMRACGVAGSTCVACAPNLADNCSAAGECRCGGGAPCAKGQRCYAGRCVCDGESCMAGCCAGTACRTPSVGACGVGGSACVPCDTASADTCASTGECRCGSGPACGPGQRCVRGACVCDRSSCEGCCEGNVCRPGDSASACGVGGAACRACAPGLKCSSGTCSLCASCPGGCCDGDRCRVPSLLACGTGGAACVACDPVRADGCSSAGKCRCGAGPPCAEGQQCVGGACVCNATSCTGCCERNACVRGDQKNACGMGGARCVRCNGARTCVDGQCK